MKILVALGIALLAGVEFLAVALRQRQLLLAISAITLGFLLFGVRQMLAGHQIAPSPNQGESDAPGDSLRRWVASTETLIHRSEASRTDWDRHWRPVLARRFEIATGQRRAKNPAAFDATGRLLFGAALWQWVDPGNVARNADHEQGPGRGALEEILQRLEQP